MAISPFQTVRNTFAGIGGIVLVAVVSLTSLTGATASAYEQDRGTVAVLSQAPPAIPMPDRDVIVPVLFRFDEAEPPSHPLPRAQAKAPELQRGAWQTARARLFGGPRERRAIRDRVERKDANT